MTTDQFNKPMISIRLLLIYCLIINLIGFIFVPDDRLFFYKENEVIKVGEFFGRMLGMMILALFTISIIVIIRKYIFKLERNKAKERIWLIVGFAIFTFASTSGAILNHQKYGSDCVMTDLWGCKGD